MIPYISNKFFKRRGYEIETFSDWMALTVKEVVLLPEGTTLKGAPEMPFGVASFLVSEDAKLLWSWLAMVEAAAAISDWDFLIGRGCF